jgi:iron-sulfur cluster assembly accessory protein
MRTRCVATRSVSLLPSRGFPIQSAFARGMSTSHTYGPDDLKLTDQGAARILELKKSQNLPELRLRLAVEGGGCSGFQYLFDTTTEAAKEDDVVFRNGEAELLVDAASMEFVKGSTIDFTEDLIRRAFEVVDNPNSEAGCGCGASFAFKGEKDGEAAASGF